MPIARDVGVVTVAVGTVAAHLNLLHHHQHAAATAFVNVGSTAADLGADCGLFRVHEPTAVEVLADEVSARRPAGLISLVVSETELLPKSCVSWSRPCCPAGARAGSRSEGRTRRTRRLG